MSGVSEPKSTSCPRSPTIVPRPEHNISRAYISKNALNVLYRLKNSGYQAFLVGGGVRDLLLGREPKDFDIVTDAQPGEIRRLFRNCRLIGRRFRLAHVHFGRDYIEVATFRGSGIDESEEAQGDQGDQVLDRSGRILRDNVYGTIDEDVWRRDFTANALYYNIKDFSIWDYSGGVEDLKAGLLRLLGDPETRYREDPVRMLRAVRFAAKLGFRLEENTEQPLWELGHLLDQVPPARLFDEVLKLFQSGHAVESFEILRHYDLYRHLFPATDDELGREDAGSFRTIFTHGLSNTDHRVQAGKPVTPMFLLAVFLWGPISRRARELLEEDNSEFMALHQACDEVVSAQQSRVSIPRRFTLPMREIITLQPRFRRRQGARSLRFLGHPRFRAAYDFMLLRAEAGEEEAEIAQWWTEIQEVGPEEQRKRFLGKRGRRPRRRPRREGSGRDKKARPAE